MKESVLTTLNNQKLEPGSKAKSIYSFEGPNQLTVEQNNWLVRNQKSIDQSNVHSPFVVKTSDQGKDYVSSITGTRPRGVVISHKYINYVNYKYNIIN